MRHHLGLLLAAGLALFLAAQPASAASGPVDPGDALVEDAVDWLLEGQGPSGCIEAGNDDPVPSHRHTVWTALALAAAGGDPDAGEPSLVDGLRETCPPDPEESQNEVNTYARHVLALAASGENPRDFGSNNWVEEILSYHTAGQFVSPDHPDAINDDAFAILALRSAGLPADDERIADASDTLLDAQNADGGWGLTHASGSTTDYTAAALQALRSASAIEPGDAVAQHAVAYLQDRVEGETGCLEMREGYAGNPQSTAWGLRALLTVHVDPRGDDWGEASPWDCLTDYRTEQGGFGTDGDASAWVTWDVVPALLGVPHGRITPTMEQPSADLSASPTPTAGEQTTLRADGAAFAGWQLPNGTILEGATADWRPEEPGDVAMSVLLVDEEGRAATASFETIVEEATESSSTSGSSSGSATDSGADDTDATPRPLAHVAAPTEAERNVTFTVTVEGEGAEQPVTAFRVQVADREPTDWRPAGTFEIAADALGEVPIQAWARDADGRVSQPAETRVDLVDADPRVSIHGPASANRTEPVVLQAEARDPDGTVANLTWTGSDGRVGEGPNATFAFDEPGPNEVRVEAVDEAGNTANATWTVHALNRPPTNVTVEPARLAANASEVVQASAWDADGDRLAFAWRAPGADEPRSWGRQLHVETGPPGERAFVVNVSDPHGGWTAARVTLHVEEEPDREQDEAAAVERVAGAWPDSAPSETGPDGEEPPATVALPERVHAGAGESRLLNVEANASAGPVVNVTVALGGPLPARGTDEVTALLPGLPAGTYELAARAADANGWGPWANATLVVEPEPESEPLEATASETSQRSTPLGALAALASVLAAVGRRRP